MAAPVIDRVLVEPPSVAPGGTVKVTIEAHDPDTGSPAKIIAFKAQVLGDDQEVVEADGVINIHAVPGDVIEDYALVDVDDVGLVISQNGANPNVFMVTVPA